MKKLLLLFLILGSFISLQAQVPKTVALTAAGTLSSTLTVDELNTVTNLTLTGNIDARDFKTMRDLMPLLAEIDISGASIVAYSGTEGTYTSGNYTYPANEVPRNAFYYKLSLTSMSIPTSITAIGRSAFNNCDGLTQVIFGTNSQLTTIGYMSFAYCDNLSEIQIPSNVTWIDYGAFRQCPVLITCVLPESIKTIGNVAFYQCSKLKNISLPTSVETIGDFAFHSCTEIPNFNISVTTILIGRGAFIGVTAPVSVAADNPNYTSLSGILYDKNKTQLIYCPPSTSGSLIIPSTVSTIAVDAFYNCSGITAITLPVGLTTLEDWAFENCTGLTTISMPASLSSIGSDALYNCTGLTSIFVNNPVPVNLSSKTDVFHGINKTTCTLNVPYNTKILYAAANQWQDFTNIVEAANGFSLAATTASVGAAENSTATVNLNANVSWTAASDQAWLTVAPASGTQSSTLTFTAEANTSITTRSATVTVSASGYDSQTVLVTQDNGSLNLTAGTLSTTLSTGELASLTKLTLTGTIDARDFKTMRDLMPMLAEVDLSGASIVAYSGSGGTAPWIASYSANDVPLYAFYNNNTGQGKTSMISIKLPTTATSIRSYAFRYCRNLNSVNIPASVLNIDSYAFQDCNALTFVQLPASLRNIGYYSFGECDGLTSITIPASVGSISYSAFRNCPQLSTFVVDAGNAYYMSENGVLFDKSKTTIIFCLTTKTGSYAIPTSVTTIGDQAFWGCQSLTSITIPSSVKSIGGGAFTLCGGLTAIEIPMSVTSIGAYAFQVCSNLTSITAKRNIPVDLSISDGVFNSVNKTSCILNVPYGTKPLYAAANQWKDFANIVEAASGFSLGAATASIGAADGSTATVDLKANVSWTASSDQSWLTVAPASGAANATLLFTATSSNTSIASRSAVVTVQSAGFDPQSVTVIQDGVDMPVNITAGTLSTMFTAAELANIRKLTLTGTIDARDFKTMRDLMPLLAEVDLSGATIVAYTGTEGTIPWNYNYSADAIPQYAFLNYNTGQGKTSLTSIKLPTGAINISQYAFTFCSGLTNIILPSALTSIGYEAFWGCSKLTSLSLPTGLTTIADWAFEQCTGLTSLSLPQTLTNIGSYAFYNCSGLTTLYAYNPTPVDLSSRNNVFLNIDKNRCTLIVPPGSESLYAAAVQWKDFNQAPVAKAGPDQTINENMPVTLDGSASFDPNGNPFTLSWVAPEGITLSSTTSATVTFTAPEILTDTAYTFTLTVTDGKATTTDIVVITVKQVNIAPVANAGLIQTVNEGDLVTLTGLDSYDFDGDPLKYYWTAPDGITLSSANAATPTFTAPEVKKETSFKFSLYVNDGKVNSIYDQVVIVVKNIGQEPIANAGAAQSVEEGSQVTLDGSGSSDPDGDQLTYEWTAPDGISLSSNTSEKPTFTAPTVSIDTDYLFTLIVNDGTANSATGTVTITVLNENSLPVANAGVGQTVTEGTTVSLDGSGSADADGDVLTYKWTAPDGIILSSTSVATPTFTAPEVNENTTYVFTLVVNDGTVDSPAGQVTIIVTQVNKAPVANSGIAQTVTEGAIVTLDGSTSTDADGDVLTYKWTAPEGITMSGTTTANPTFVAPSTATSTTFTFGLTVNDGTADSQQSTVTITVENNWTLSPLIATSSMKVYPNPFVGPVTIDMGENLRDSGILSIYNIQGSLIMQKEINESKTVINLSDLISGSYLLKINTGNKVQSKILIRQ